MSTQSGDKSALDPRLANLTKIAKVAQASLGHMTPVQQARGLEQLTRRLQRGRGVLSSRWLLVGGALAAAAIALVVVPRLARQGAPAPLAYHVEGAVIGPGGSIVPRPATGADTTLRFADGSEVKLLAGARGRLASVDHQGARFAIERGAAQVRITPRPGAH